ncbi:MAG: TM0106 family RecB-like putative nuclease [Hyphomicrobiaceae bacterium]
MRNTASGLLFSASDLVTFIGCRHATWLDATAARGGPRPPDIVDAQTTLLQQRGLEHERAYLRELGEAGLTIETIAPEGTVDERAAATREAMKRGADIIYQGALIDRPWHGYSDFLRRVEVPSLLGGWSYVVIDTKLARTAKASHAVQLGVYAKLLKSDQGVLPGTLHVKLGDGSEASLKTSDCYDYIGAAMQRFEQFVAEPPAASEPEPCAQCQYCHWATVCEAHWIETDHLSGVANMRSTQARYLREAGISTMAQLASLKIGAVKGLAPAIVERLGQQARLQVAKRNDGQDRFEILPTEAGRGFCRMPKPNPGDMFFDMEGDPLYPGGLEYLLGFLTGTADKAVFTPFWAHDRAEEKRAFEQAVDFIVERLGAHPAAHVYHYASYEASALKRLSTLHGTREAEIDDLLRRGKLVDLYRVVAEGVRVSEPRYSIKNMEVFYMEKRAGEVKTAGESVVMYERWRELQDATLIAEIAEYNRIDCVSTIMLRDWLLRIRPATAGWFVRTASGEDRSKTDKREAAEQRTAELSERLHRSSDPSAAVLADLLEFHRREAKPDYWAMFDRQSRPDEDLIDDAECLGGLVAAPVAQGVADKQSLVFTYDYPAQDTKIREDDKPLLADSLEPAGEVAMLDEKARRIQLRRGKKAGALPHTLSLIPSGPINTKPIKEAIFRVAEAACAGGGDYAAVRALVAKAAPRLSGGKTLAGLAGDPLARAVEAVQALDESYLVMQGPPGAGKTYTSARAIVTLLQAGKRVGVASNSHKAINKLLEEIEAVALAKGFAFRGIKKSSKESQSFSGMYVGNTTDNADVAGHQLIAGTAWLFSRTDLDRTLDYLFVDEAGQVSLANVVAMGTSARNIVLVGDQAQLGQPIKGTHPGESGSSALEYVLREHATVPDDLGIFLPASRRMHPNVCGFISEAFYDGRLEAAAGNERQGIVMGSGAHAAIKASGLSFVNVEHTGCGQRSEQEAEVVNWLVDSLLEQEWSDRDGNRRRLTLDDIVIVTPYNMQVACLEGTLPADARIGTVDKFQGQEAPVVIVSMTTSSGEEMPRDHEFLFSRNRLNVAISRAQGLAILVASPRLLAVPCKTIGQMKLVNALCWAKTYAQRVPADDQLSGHRAA